MSKRTNKKPFTGHFREVYDTDYLASWDIEDNKDLILTFKEFATEDVRQPDNTTDSCIVGYFKETKLPNGKEIKPMIINVTNVERLFKLTGSWTADGWIGATVAIYVDSSVKNKAIGGTGGLRIRPDKVITKAKQPLTPDSKMWPAAIEKLKNGSTSLDKIKEMCTLTKANEKLLLDAVREANTPQG